MATTGITSNKASSELINSLNQTPKAETKKKDEVGKDQFLTLLVEELKHQDPLDPSDSKQFMAQLAQFSSLEKLISIDEKLSASSASDTGLMAAYLGKLVSLKDSQISVEGHDGGLVQVQLDADASDVSIELLNKDGSVASTVSAGTLSKGKYTIALDDVSATDGQYNYRVKATDASGRAVTTKSTIAGIVSGFVPGPEPKLLIGSREITTSDITEVGVVPSGS